jgi:hypothetical protein
MRNLAENTQAERAALIAGGMIELTRSEWLERVASYGYRVEQAECFSYTNGNSPPNARPYKARCVSNYTRKSDGLGFAHYKGTRDAAFRALQDMRFNCYVWARGRIYEL